MSSREDYEEMVSMSETLMEGGKRQIELAGFIKDKTKKLLEAFDEGKVKIEGKESTKSPKSEESSDKSDKEDRKKVAVIVAKKAMA